uniref:Uncharacterized protein n=1 Tax=Arundo donax TaxID=35708 RepID=A0A0A9G065_ARUDO
MYAIAFLRHFHLPFSPPVHFDLACTIAGWDVPLYYTHFPLVLDQCLYGIQSSSPDAEFCLSISFQFLPLAIV